MSAIEIAQRRAAEARANREKMPIVSRWVDMTRADGFEGAKVTGASEGGITVGKITGREVAPIVQRPMVREGDEVKYVAKMRVSEAVRFMQQSGIEYRHQCLAHWANVFGEQYAAMIRMKLKDAI